MRRLNCCLIALCLLLTPAAHAIDDAVYAPMELIPQGWERRDKWAHALMGGFIYTNVRMAYGHRKAVAATLIVAIGKEVYDAHQGRPFNPYDIGASMAVPLTLGVAVRF